jgi:hypothetical protein
VISRTMWSGFGWLVGCGGGCIGWWNVRCVMAGDFRGMGGGMTTFVRSVVGGENYWSGDL